MCRALDYIKLAIASAFDFECT